MLASFFILQVYPFFIKMCYNVIKEDGAMRIIITDTSPVWRWDDPVFEQLKDELLIVCLNGLRVSMKYECFVNLFDKNASLGFPYSDDMYTGLQSVATDLFELLKDEDDILFLTDDEPKSLLPFYVIKDLMKNEKHRCRIHVCAISPDNYKLADTQKIYNKFMADLSGITSLLYYDSNIREMKTEVAYCNYFNVLPFVIDGIHKMTVKSIFDWRKMAYVPYGADFSGVIDLTANIENTEKEEAKFRDMFSKMFMVLGEEWPYEDRIIASDIKDITNMPIRKDGKQICNYLKSLRCELAKANGIELNITECDNDGPCAGTCPKCDAEATFLRKELKKLPEDKRVIPDCTLSNWGMKL